METNLTELQKIHERTIKALRQAEDWMVIHGCLLDRLKDKGIVSQCEDCGDYFDDECARCTEAKQLLDTEHSLRSDIENFGRR